MGGSIDRQYGGKPGRCAEYNVVSDAKAAQVAYGADWQVTMAPLDTAGIVRLTGTPYARVRDADNPLAQAVMENYRIWAKKHKSADANRASSILFDAVAVYLAFDQRLCQMRDIRLPRHRRWRHPAGPRRQAHPCCHGLERPGCVPRFVGQPDRSVSAKPRAVSGPA